MAKGAPAPPDPYKVADAQSQANTQAAYQNFGLQNVNQYTPYGNQTYNQSGWYTTTDPTTGKVTNSPRYESHATLSPGEQKILDLNTQLRTNMGQLGVDQSQRAQQLLGTAASTDDLRTQWQNGPQAANLQTTFGGNSPLQMSVASGGDFQRSVAGGGDILHGYADSGPVQRSLASGGDIATGWGDTGSVQGNVGEQEFRQDQTATDRGAVEQAMMDRYQRQAAPRNEAQEADMANRGLSPGGQGYSSMQDARNREFAEANTNAFLASGEESRASQNAFNQASAARLQQDLSRGEFANQAQQQTDDQAARRAGFQNAAERQKFEELQAQGQFANAAQGQVDDQSFRRAGFNNAATQQQWEQNLGQGTFANAATQLEWLRNLGMGEFANAAAGQDYRQAAGRAEFANNAATSMFDMGGKAADRNNALRQSEWTENLSERNQSYNEMAALAGLSQVNTPSFQPFQGSTTQAAPIGQYIYDDFNIRSQQASDKMQGIFGIGANIAGMLPWTNMLGFGGK